MRHIISIPVLVFIATLWLTHQSHAQVSPGNILVTDLFFGRLYKVNPSNGNCTEISRFRDSSQGPLGLRPAGVALESSGNILVIFNDEGTDNGGVLLRVNPSNGSRTLVSDFGDSTQGELGSKPVGVALDSSGIILVVDTAGGTGGLGALFGVNPSGGNRILISDFGDPSKGVVGFNPAGVIVFTVKCGGLDATMIGTPGDDVINGTSLADVIAGLGGKDTIDGLGSVDFICGGLGDDTLSGGVDNDRLFGERGFDTLNGGLGNDRLSVVDSVMIE